MAFNDNFVVIIAGSNPYYTRTTLSTIYQEITIGNRANTVVLVNDSATDMISYSFDGATLAGEMKANETFSITLSGKSSVYLKGQAGGGEIRLWAW